MWSGLANPAVIAVGAMFVISEALSRTGALGFLGNMLGELGRRGRRRILGAMMVSAAILSAFVNNTTVVLVGLPIVLAMCERLDHPPSRYLIPLSYASIAGGMMTLIGTSTNVIVAEAGGEAVARYLPKHVFEPGMWSFFPMGVIFVVVGVVYMAYVGVRLLPDRVALSMTLSRGIPKDYVTEAEVLADSSLVGRTLADLRARHPGLRILQLIRDDVIRVPQPQLELEVGDVLLVKGGAAEIMDLQTITGAALLPEIESGELRLRQVDSTLAEVIVPPSSRWIGRPVSEVGFRARYGVSVMAVQRHGHHIRQKVGELPVEPADILLVQGTVASLRNLRASDNLILIEGVGREVKIRRRAPLALGGLLLFVGLVSSGFMTIDVAAVFTATALVVSRCLTLQEAFDAIDWNVIFMLAGALALGAAMDKVGLAKDAATGILDTLGTQNPWILVGVLYIVTATLTDFLSNQAAAALMIPIVVRASEKLDFNPQTLLYTVAFAASAAFMTPMGYQTNLLVYSPGGYRFRDFMTAGAPLRLLFWILATLLIPVFYPPS